MRRPTFIIDLNEVRHDNQVVLSLFHTLEYGPRVLVEQPNYSLDSGDIVTVYNDDEDSFYEARIEKRLSDHEFAAVVYLGSSWWPVKVPHHSMSSGHYQTSSASVTHGGQVANLIVQGSG